MPQVQEVGPRRRHQGRALEGQGDLLVRVVRSSKLRNIVGLIFVTRRWKHAATCHQGSTIDGECDIFVEDDVFRAVVAAQEAGDEDAEGESVHEDDMD